jgi:hypothetical protein
VSAVLFSQILFLVLSFEILQTKKMKRKQFSQKNVQHFFKGFFKKTRSGFVAVAGLYYVLQSPGQPGTQDPPPSASWVLPGLKACATTPSLKTFLKS